MLFAHTYLNLWECSSYYDNTFVVVLFKSDFVKLSFAFENFPANAAIPPTSNIPAPTIIPIFVLGIFLGFGGVTLFLPKNKSSAF